MAQGQIKALYVMGENPLMSEAHLNHVKEAFEALDFLVVQDIFMTQTAKMAHVVFPAALFAEKEGTFTNTERRVQRVRKAVEPPGESLEDWKIIAGFSRAMGYPMEYTSAEEIFGEIASLTPSYHGMSYARLEKEGLQWPCPSEGHPGTPILHVDKFTRGKGLFHPIEYRPPDEVPDSDYPFLLTTGRYYYHYHTGTMTRRSRGLEMLCPEGFVEMNPKDAQRLSIQEGEKIRLRSRRGSIHIKVKKTGRCPEGVLFVPFHFQEYMANLLTNPALDPVAKTPELKVCAVSVEKIMEEDSSRE